MRRAARVMLVSLVAVVAAVLLAFGQTLTPVIALMAAGTVYIVKGTNSASNQIPDSAYPQFAHDYNQAVGAAAPDPITTPYPYFLVPYPASFWPITPPSYIFSPTFDQSVSAGVNSLETARPVSYTPVSPTEPNDVVWGYSQGATVVTQYKRDYNAAYPTNPTAVAPAFVLVANPNRPNGGILERGVTLGTIPIFGVTFSGATPTNTAGVPDATITTYDIARQYVGVADGPVNPLNLIADANAIMAFFYLHGQFPYIDPSNAINQGTYGDTQYYLIPTYPLPLLMPLQSIPVIGSALADTLDPVLRVLVEAGYDRTTSPGVPTPWNPLYFPDPVTFSSNLLIAIPTGLDNGIGDVTGTRPFGTVRPGPYGVGGPSTPLITPTPVSPPTSPALSGSPIGPSAITDLGSVSVQNSTAATTLVPAASSPQSDTAATTLVPAASSPSDTGPTPQPVSVREPNSVNNDAAQPGTTSISTSQPQPSKDDQSKDSNPVRLNAPRNSLTATPGGSQSGADSTHGTSHPTIANPSESAASDVTDSTTSTGGRLPKTSTGDSTAAK